MKSIFKIIISALMLTAVIALTAGCQQKPIEETFLVYNNTDVIITAVYISPEEDPFLDEDAIKLAYLEAPIAMRTNLNTVIEVPADMHGEELNIFVDGLSSKGMISTKIAAGKMFADGVWGLEIGVDDSGALTVKLLGDGDV